MVTRRFLSIAGDSRCHTMLGPSKSNSVVISMVSVVRVRPKKGGEDLTNRKIQRQMSAMELGDELQNHAVIWCNANASKAIPSSLEVQL